MRKGQSWVSLAAVIMDEAERYTDGEYLKGLGWRGTRIRRVISSARLRIRLCVTGKELYLVFVLFSC